MYFALGLILLIYILVYKGMRKEIKNEISQMSDDEIPSDLGEIPTDYEDVNIENMPSGAWSGSAIVPVYYDSVKEENNKEKEKV